MTIPQVFLVIGLLNAIVAFYIFMLVPEYLLRFVAFVATRLVYRFKVRGDEHIPTEGAAILVCNHVSFVDPVLLMAASPRPIRFIMDHQIFQHAGARLVLPPRQGDPDRAAEGRRPRPTSRRSRAPAQVLDDGDLLCIFPEGAITRDGELGEFKGGVMKLLEIEPGAGGPARAAEPVGLVLLARRRPGDGQAVPARPVQPGRARRRRGGARRRP